MPQAAQDASCQRGFARPQVAAQENDKAGMQYLRYLGTKRERCRFVRKYAPDKLMAIKMMDRVRAGIM